MPSSAPSSAAPSTASSAARGHPIQVVARHTGQVKGPLPSLDLELEAKVQRLALELARAGLVSSMHDVSDGGLAIALVESCVAADQPVR